jgi:ABC-2 type transport system permease protein
VKNPFIKSAVRMLAIANKEWIQIRRDARSLILSLLMPVILILIFGYALSVDVKKVAVVVWDQDKTAFSRSLIEKFSHTEYLTLIRYVDNYREIDRLINNGTVKIALIIPSEFEKRFKAGKTADVQAIVDGADSTTGTVALGYIKGIIADFNQNILFSQLNQLGISGKTLPVDVRSRIWYNSELKSKNFIVPGIIVIVMAIISALITSLTISREWERGTMETLITTPVRKHEIYFGKLIPYVFIALFDLVLTVTVGYFVFGVPLRGSFVELYLVALLFLIGMSGLGMVISSATRSQVLSVQISVIITFLPAFVLSGYIFPVANMPLIVRAITYLIPAKYLIIYMKGIALKGIGYQIMWLQILFLFLFALVVTIVSMNRIVMKIPED